MSVYVDEIKEYPVGMIKEEAQKYGKLWCHCWADTTSELIQFCTFVGIPVSWIQRNKKLVHVDLVPSWRKKAIRKGAIESSLKEIIVGKTFQHH